MGVFIAGKDSGIILTGLYYIFCIYGCIYNFIIKISVPAILSAIVYILALLATKLNLTICLLIYVFLIFIFTYDNYLKEQEIAKIKHFYETQNKHAHDNPQICELRRSVNKNLKRAPTQELN